MRREKKRGSSEEVEVEVQEEEEVEEGFLADITFGSNFDSREGKGLTGRGSSWDDTCTGINLISHLTIPIHYLTYLARTTYRD